MSMSWLVLAVAIALPQQIRDLQTRQTGTAILTGIVMTDSPRPEPIRRALVTVTIGPQTSRQWQTSTDERGRFVLQGLAAGSARVVVSKPAYVTTYYGARRPGSTIGVPVVLTDGQTTDIKVAMPKGGVISGTVFDQNGAPVEGVPVRVVRLTTSSTGRSAFQPNTNSALIANTDDRGAFRIYGLLDGTYFVSAQPRLAPGAVLQTTSEEVQWAQRIVAGSGSARPAVTPMPESAPSVAYTTIYHPGTPRLADAAPVTLSPGQERSGINIRLQLVRTARVQGTVSMPDGRPGAGAVVSLLPKDGSLPADAASVLIMVEVGIAGGAQRPAAADGTFVLSGIEPGDYFLLARTGNFMPGRATAAGIERTWAMTDVRVDGTDLTGLSLRLAPTVSVAGRIAFEGVPPATAPRLNLSLRAMDSRGFGAQNPSLVAEADGTFQLDGVVPATYRLGATMAGRTLVSAMTDGRDVADIVFEVPPAGLSGLVLTFTDRAAEISGVLLDAAGRPTSDLSIILFAANPDLWFNGSRWTRPIVRPASDGWFAFSGLAPGDYFLAALTDVSTADLTDDVFLREVATAAIKVTVAAGEKKTHDIRVK